VSGSGIWAICKSALCSRQKPCQHPTTQFFTGRMPFLPPNQQCQNTEGTHSGQQKPNLKHKEKLLLLYEIVECRILRLSCAILAKFFDVHNFLAVVMLMFV